MTRSFKQASDRLNKSKQEKYPLIPGFLGFMVNGVETVEVPTRPGYVFVRLRGVTNEVISAFNDEVSPVYNLPVLVTRDDTDNTRYRVAARDTGVYINWGGASSYLPRHGDSHSFAGTAGSGGDVVWVYGRQMMPLNVIPSGTVGSGNVYVMPGVYYQAGAWKYGGDEYSVSLIPAKPTGTLARMMLLYLDENSDLAIATGTTFSASLTGTAAILPYVPNLSSNYHVPLAGIRLTSTTSVVTWGDIYDLRPWIVGDGFIPTGTFAPNTSAYVTIGNTSDLIAERALTAGAGISITDNGANSTVVISATNTGTSSSVSAPTYPAIYDDNTFKTTGTAIHFNDNLSVIVSGTSVWIDGSAASIGGGADLLIYDGSTFKATGTAIHFNDNLSVAVTGSSVYIDAIGVTGSAGTPGAAGPPGSNTVFIYDNDIFKITGTAIHFNNNLDVITSGSSAWINGQAGGGGGGGSNILIYEDATFKVTGTAIVFGSNIDVAVTGSVAFVSSAIKVYVEDNFNRADAATVGTPQIGDNPSMWNNGGNGDWGITSNTLAPKSGLNENHVFWDTGVLRYTMSFTMTTKPADGGAVIRISPGTALDTFLIHANTGAKYTLYKKVGPIYTLLATGSTANPTSGDTLIIKVSQTRIQVFVNGSGTADIDYISLAGTPVGSCCGFRENGTTVARFDDLRIYEY